jgi:hypothetical protein
MLIDAGLLRGKERVAVVGYIVEKAESDSNACDERGRLYHRLLSTFCPSTVTSLTEV